MQAKPISVGAQVRYSDDDGQGPVGTVLASAGSPYQWRVRWEDGTVRTIPADCLADAVQVEDRLPCGCPIDSGCSARSEVLGEYADQRGHDVFWMTAAERSES